MEKQSSDIIMERSRSIKSIYRAYGLRNDVREARKLLNLPKNTPKKEVNKQLKEEYEELFQDYYNQPVHLYTIYGESRAEKTVYVDKNGKQYEKNDKKRTRKAITVLTKPQEFLLTFQSEKIYKFSKINIYEGGNDIKYIAGLIKNGLPTLDGYEKFVEEMFQDNTQLYNQFMKQGNGQISYKVNTILQVQRRKIPATKKSLAKVPLYSATIELPLKEFRGFKDSGNMMCVPETVYYHLTRDERNKKLKKLGI